MNARDEADAALARMVDRLAKEPPSETVAFDVARGGDCTVRQKWECHPHTGMRLLSETREYPAARPGEGGQGGG